MIHELNLVDGLIYVEPIKKVKKAEPVVEPTPEVVEPTELEAEEKKSNKKK